MQWEWIHKRSGTATFCMQRDRLCKNTTPGEQKRKRERNHRQTKPPRRTFYTDILLKHSKTHIRRDNQGEIQPKPPIVRKRKLQTICSAGSFLRSANSIFRGHFRASGGKSSKMPDRQTFNNTFFLDGHFRRRFPGHSGEEAFCNTP